MQRVSTPDFWEFYRAEFSPAEERSFRHRQTDAVSRPQMGQAQRLPVATIFEPWFSGEL